jgi:hypothetical protein
MPPKVLSQLHLPRTKRLQLKLSQQHPLQSNTIIDDDDETDGPDEVDYHRSYGRPKVYAVDEKVIDFDDTPLSDYVIVRLAVARAKAMQKYRETYVKA